MVIGRITRPHGVRGEVRVKIHTDQPERFSWLKRVWVGDETPTPIPVEGARPHQGVVLLKLAGYDSRNQAETLRGRWLQVPIEEAIPLAEDELFHFQIIGLQVRTVEGEVLGEVVEILETGANDVFVIRGAPGEILLPDLPEVILEINLESGWIEVDVPAGLRDG